MVYMYLNKILAGIPEGFRASAREFLFSLCTRQSLSDHDGAYYCGDAGTLAIGFIVLGQSATSDTPEIATRREYCVAMGHALTPDGDPIGRFHQSIKLWHGFAEQWGGHWERELAELLATARTWATFIDDNGVVMKRDETRPFKIRRSNVADLQFGTDKLLDFGNDAIRECWSYQWSSYNEGSPAGTPWLCRTNGGWSGGVTSGITLSTDGVILRYSLSDEQFTGAEFYKWILRLMNDQPVYVLSCEHKKLVLFIPGIAELQVHDGRQSMLQQKWAEGFTEWTRNLLDGILPEDYEIVRVGDRIQDR